MAQVTVIIKLSFPTFTNNCTKHIVTACYYPWIHDGNNLRILPVFTIETRKEKRRLRKDTNHPTIYSYYLQPTHILLFLLDGQLKIMDEPCEPKIWWHMQQRVTSSWSINGLTVSFVLLIKLPYRDVTMAILRFELFNERYGFLRWLICRIGLSKWCASITLVTCRRDVTRDMEWKKGIFLNEWRKRTIIYSLM